jgi:CRISPR-associated endoribonuclease Cas6
MRLHFHLSPNARPVPFDYQHYLTGAFHKWLGSNDLHDSMSLYSLSWLYEGRARNGAIDFPHGAHWFVSLHDEALVEPLVNSALRDPEVCSGMRVTRIEQQATPRFGERHTFKVGSPVLARSREVEGKVKHYVYSDPEADAVLTATLRHKLDRAGLGAPHNAATVHFDKTYRNPKTKLVTIKDTHNRASICPVTVEGTPEAVAFAWNVGVGHGTGSGFGSLL